MLTSLYKLLFVFLIITISVNAKNAEEFGFKHLKFNYNGDNVDILVKSAKGEENQKKGIFFFCQGSLPQPLIKYSDEGIYGVFPFNPDSLAQKYHLIIVSKPYIPLIADAKTLSRNFTFTDSTGNFPKEYSERNLLDYYVDRNIEIIKFLQKQKWVSRKELVVAGHSEGSTIAAKMASKSLLVTHLIYSGGNPMGRIMTMIQQNRAYENDSLAYGEMQFQYWEDVVNNKDNLDDSKGDTYRATYEFSEPAIDYLEKVKIPVLVCYATKDWSVPFNDFLRVEMIRRGMKNFTFKAYIGLEHNYFAIDANNKVNHNSYNWDKVANHWLEWLKN